MSNWCHDESDVWLHDGDGIPIKSVDGAINVHAEDIHYEIINDHFTQPSGTTETFASTGAVGDNVITTSDGTTFAANDRITIREGSLKETNSIKVISVSVDDITIDRPLENAYTTAAIIELAPKSMNVLGTISSPEKFQVKPPPGVVWHITRLNLSMFHTNVPDDAKFGDLTKLTNGFLIRQEGQIVRNFTVWRDNGDILEDVGVDLRYAQKAGGGSWGTSARWTLRSAGVVARLDGDTADVLYVFIQDDLTGLTDLELKIQGHVETI